MARWRLTAAHYLNVKGTQWEYIEVNRTSGKQERKIFDVPVHLDPNEPSDWNVRYNKDEGDVVVSDGKGNQPKDIIFSGPPTPDMDPLDDAARKITDSLRSSWKHPIESLPGTYSQSLIDQFTFEIAKVQSTANRPTEGISDLLTAMTAMMKQNQDMMMLLASAVKPGVERRL